METFAPAPRRHPAESLESALRTVDVARRAGYSVQQVRNLEHDGVLPPAERSSAGYRAYTERHVQAALAYKALSAGAGPADAKRLMRTAHADPAGLLALLDDVHARLHVERRELAVAREAAGAIAAEPIDDPRPSDAMTITELAAALGIRPSTLRHWDAEGLVTSRRPTARSTRTYSPSDVRDARIVHQLRKAGHRIVPLRALMPQLREAGRREDVLTLLTSRAADIDRRSRALLRGAAVLDGMLATSDRGPDRT